MRFSSEVGFTSFLVYPSKANFPNKEGFRDIIKDIKSDRMTKKADPPTSMIRFAVRRLIEEQSNFPVLSECFGADVIAVPIPRNTPQKPGSLWPALRICEELAAAGLVRGVAPILRRERAVPKSSAISVGNQRPDPTVHYDSMSVSEELPLVPEVQRLLLVDDMITRGSTVLGCHARLAEVFVDYRIDAFAIARTVSGGSLDSIIDPVAGKCAMRGDLPVRDP